MVNLQLYIEGTRVDLFDFESVVLVDSIQNVKDINKIFIPFTRTFSVPASENNNKLFKHFYNEHISGFDPRRKRDSVIELNHQTYKVGKIKIEGATLKNNKAYSYKVTFFGDTADLKDVLGDATLGSLTKLEELFLHDWTPSNVKTYANDGIDATIDSVTYTDALIYPLVSFASRVFYDSSEESLNNLYIDTGASTHNGGVWWQDLKPAILVNVILKSIEAEFPAIKFSDDFFNNTNSDVNNLYMWTHSNNENVADVDERGYAEVPLKMSNPSADIDGDEVEILDGGFAFKITGDYADTGLQEDRYVSYLVSVKIGNNSNGLVDVILHQDGKGEISKRTFINNALQPQLSGGTKDFGVEINSGIFKLYLRTENGNNVDIRQGAEVIITRRKARGLFSSPDLVRGSLELTFGNDTTSVNVSQQFEPTRVMPKMKIIDFLVGLFRMFNLTAYKQDDEIVIKPLNDFYGDSNVLHDITEYVDRTQSEVSTDLPYRKIDFKYKGNKTILSRNHGDTFGKEWGADEYKGDSEVYFFGGEYEVEPPFEHMKFERLFDQNTNDETNYMVGTALDENLSKTSSDPVLFYAVNSADYPTDVNGNPIVDDLMIVESKIVDPNSNEYGEPNVVSIVDGYYIASNYQTLNNTSQSLHFFPEINEYYLGEADGNGDPFDGSTSKSLFETFYRDYIESLFRVTRRIVKLKAKLPLSFHLSFSLADDIRIFDKVYRINEIKTNFLTGVSELELLNVIERVQYRDFDDADYTDNVNSSELTIDRLIPTIDKTLNSVDGGATQRFTIPSTLDVTETKIDGLVTADTDTTIL
jgi:hypothetical protein